jgi:hypothetical protein
VALTGSVSTLTLVGIEAFCMTTFIYLTGQFELLCDSIRNASEKVKYRLEKRQQSSAGSNGINSRPEFTSDKNTKVQISRANTDSVSSAKGKGNIIYATHKPFFYVWLTVHLELYLYNKQTRCTVCPHFIE